MTRDFQGACTEKMSNLAFQYNKPESGMKGSRIDDLLSCISRAYRHISLTGLTPSALAYTITRITGELNRPALVVVPSGKDIQAYSERLDFFLGSDTNGRTTCLEDSLFRFPSIMDGSLLFSTSHVRGIKERLESLYTILTSPKGKIFVVSSQALLEKAIPSKVLLENTEYIVEGEEIDRDELVKRLVSRGYYVTTLVEEPGDASVRGGILDIFPPLYNNPVRIELFGDTVETIRTFNPATQKSVHRLEDAIILPAKEVILSEDKKDTVEKKLFDSFRQLNPKTSSQHSWLNKIREWSHFTGIERLLSFFYETPGKITDFLPSDLIIVYADPGEHTRAITEYWEKAQKDFEKKVYEEEWTPPPETFLSRPEDISEDLKGWQILENDYTSDSGFTSQESTRLHFETEDNQDVVDAFRAHEKRERFLEPLVNKLNLLKTEGISSFLVCSTVEQARRFAELLESYDLRTEYTKDPFAYLSRESSTVRVLHGHLDKGFSWPTEGFAIITEEEILGTKPRRRPKKAAAGAFINSFKDLSSGDLVVHIDHGIGIYRGIDHITVDGISNDFLVIEYQNEDRLYIPVDRIHRVQKYLGMDDQPPRLDRLGGKSWEISKKKAEESIRQMAEELLQIYALRKLKQGYSFSPPDEFYKEFEATFPFEETPDQLDAISEVLADMARPRPMDRLICGDVGFGKTEVAIRAAFKAVMDGKQVAMLVPTTILAEQHYQTFRERFDNYPVFVEVLSRFKTRAQQKKIIKQLKEGKIDIVIGTHRLLQADVAFRDLGLLIIDEEHRFGVKDKEKLKKLRACVDVLSLSATPIPRTLHMSLMGIRDLSTIETPPQERYGVETYICKFDEEVIRTAIIRELQRNGQVFFVHNRVKTIYNMANLIRKLVPEAQVGVAHGQMQERELENVMEKFVKKEIDVLVCSTIIESGLDIPTANTIIINRADRFGLAQIYQLRGRVGRADKQAYAYLLIPGKHLITREAEKRFRALLNFSELGSGFRVALNDLQIRGGGNLLGAAQSGHVAAIGYEMYVELIQKTIQKLKGELVEEPPEPEIDLRLSAFIPESYVQDINQRLVLYKRLAGSRSKGEIKEVAVEIRDRFGPLPAEVNNLLNVTLIKLWLRKLHVTKLLQNKKQFVLSFAENTPLNPEAIFEMIKKFPKQISISPEQKLIISSINGDQDRDLEFLKLIIQKLTASVNKNIRKENHE
ncbi:MAG TPA: transcription-repair coupling factor [Deltaproteobacteria bacterium]|nr:transcription-repair coupling factor [Deltaproteobacteria bacterium]